jgi:hypothetical protein
MFIARTGDTGSLSFPARCSSTIPLPAKARSSTIMVAASLLPMTSNSSRDAVSWIFARFINVASNLELGVGDTIHICPCSSCSLCVPFDPPNFCGIIVKIRGWSATHISFKVCPVSGGVVVPGGCQTIYLPVNIARLSWYHWIWGSIFPFPRCSQVPHTQPFTLCPK